MLLMLLPSELFKSERDCFRHSATPGSHDQGPDSLRPVIPGAPDVLHSSRPDNGSDGSDLNGCRDRRAEARTVPPPRTKRPTESRKTAEESVVPHGHRAPSTKR